MPYLSHHVATVCTALLFLALSLVQGGCSPARHASPAEGALSLTILHTNDTHSHIAGINKYGNACFDDTDCRGGLARIATAIRTVVVLLLAWGMVFLTGSQHGIRDISQRSMLFLILSGLATGASWMCYYKAIQIGEVSKVVPIDKFSLVITIVMAFIFLHEAVSVKSVIGAVLITGGTLLMVL